MYVVFCWRDLILNIYLFKHVTITHIRIEFKSCNPLSICPTYKAYTINIKRLKTLFIGAMRSTDVYMCRSDV